MGIKKTDPVEDIIEKYPEAYGFLLNRGLQCVQCGETVWGTLEEFLQGKNVADIDGFVREMNEQVKSGPGKGGRDARIVCGSRERRTPMTIRGNYERMRADVPGHVAIVAAAKTRTADEVRELIDAGLGDVGMNYVQEAEDLRRSLGRDAQRVRWHLIGHLQTNKVNKALSLFDVIQTVDSLKLARAISARAEKTTPVLIEINSGREPQKTGLLPEDAERTVRDIARLGKISIKGLMTMGPRFGDPEDARPYYREMKRLFDHVGSLRIPGVEMGVLSMGMSNAYRVAIEEGSTMIRPGTILFGERASPRSAKPAQDGLAEL
ncbi:MAG: YggS family pyridoxal phosphate-dependent enzyme [Elusimicrobiota bacterium]